MSSHSVILGGSNAQRMLSCPASYQEALKAKVPDIESVYAAEGTMLHTVIADLVERKISSKSVRAVGYKGKLPVVLTEEHEETLAKALDALAEIKNKYPGEKPWRVLSLEESMKLPDVTGAFGTVDLVVANDTTVVILDWKFGGGVAVYALYTLPSGDEQLNAQGAFYAICARHKYRRQFKGKKIVIAVVQPRMDPPYSLAETDDEELDGFHVALNNAVIEALGRDAYRERGEHCKFAVCQATCPLFVGAVLDLAILDPAKAAMIAAAGGEETEYGAFLSRAMTLAELAETWAAEIRRQAHVFLEDGGRVREWKLVPKRASRKWIDSDEVTAKALLAAGAAKSDIYTKPELKSVKQVEDTIKPKKIQIPAELFEMVSTGTTITRTDDPRPESSHGQVISDLREVLKSLG